jgi:sialate O-acetylesterase
MKANRLAGLFRSFVFTAATSVFISLTAFSAVESAPLPFVSPIFGDNMVLQRGKTNTLWGWAKPGEEIRVTVATHTVKTVARDDGRWSVQIQPPAPGGPYTVIIDGPQHVEFHEVLVGDVWLCGGQSNMELGLAQARNASEEVKAADHPKIRFFVVRQRVAYTPTAAPQGSWKICSSNTAGERGGLSAVAYFFGRRLQQDIDVPIGLVVDCVGGTPAESWTSAGTLRSLKDFDTALDEVARLNAKGAPQYGNFISHWYDEYDPGQKDNAWFRPNLDDADWKPVTIPGGFRELGVPDTPALCYFRKSVVLPDPVPAGPARILLGIVERMETTCVNGRQVGASAWVENPRAYGIPGGTLEPGTNVITVRVFKTKPDGGFKSKPEELKLVLGNQTEIPLAGDWKGKLSVDARPPHPLPAGFENWPVMPAVLYNGMIDPVAPLAITGAIWYQGEANTSRAAQYRKLLPAMIADWRKSFGQDDFPFYIVSLPAFMEHKSTPVVEDDWAELRGAQDFVANTVTNSGLAVAIDVGDANNIHPKDKREVGERLALVALARHYGKNIPYSGPRFASMERLPSALKLSFTHTDGGLVVKGDTLEEFSICGEDRKWHWAYAKIVGDGVVLSSSEVRNPIAARYAWQSNPKATLFNGAGLPAIPFRTDDGGGRSGR